MKFVMKKQKEQKMYIFSKSTGNACVIQSRNTLREGTGILYWEARRSLSLNFNFSTFCTIAAFSASWSKGVETDTLMASRFMSPLFFISQLIVCYFSTWISSFQERESKCPSLSDTFIYIQSPGVWGIES